MLDENAEKYHSESENAYSLLTSDSSPKHKHLRLAKPDCSGRGNIRRVWPDHTEADVLEEVSPKRISVEARCCVSGWNPWPTLEGEERQAKKLRYGRDTRLGEIHVRQDEVNPGNSRTNGCYTKRDVQMGREIHPSLSNPPTLAFWIPGSLSVLIMPSPTPEKANWGQISTRSYYILQTTSPGFLDPSLMT